MKRFIVAGVLFGMIYGPSMVFAVPPGIPVFDASNNMQSIQQVMHMIEQIQQLKNQLSIAENQLKQMSDVRNMAGIIDSVYDNDMNVDFGKILKDAGIESAEDLGLSGAAADIYNQKTRNTAQRKGRADKYMEQTIDRFQELKKLVAKVNSAPDAKDIMDLQARIQSEEVLLQNELLKLEMMEAQAAAENEMIKEKNRQRLLNMKGNPEDFRF